MKSGLVKGRGHPNLYSSPRERWTYQSEASDAHPFDPLRTLPNKSLRQLRTDKKHAILLELSIINMCSFIVFTLLDSR